YPTVLWRPGEVVVDQHRIAIPSDVTGRLDIEVGMYEPETGKRLVLSDGASSLIAGAVSVDPVASPSPGKVERRVSATPQTVTAGGAVTVNWRLPETEYLAADGHLRTASDYPLYRL